MCSVVSVSCRDCGGGKFRLLLAVVTIMLARPFHVDQQNEICDNSVNI